VRAAAAPAGTAVPVTLRSEGGPGLRVWLLPEADSTLMLGDNPGVRGADENDAALDRHSRPFLLLRREARERRSAFLAVIEPFAGEPFIRSIGRAPGRGPALRISGDGYDKVVSLAAPASVRLPLHGIEDGAIVLEGSARTLPPAGSVIRLQTGDGWTYPFNVTGAEQAPGAVRLRVLETAAFTFNRATAKLTQTAYPQREHDGPIHVEWIGHLE
jgi:hypothetical protein